MLDDFYAADNLRAWCLQWCFAALLVGDLYVFFVAASAMLDASCLMPHA